MNEINTVLFSVLFQSFSIGFSVWNILLGISCIGSAFW